MQIKNKNSIFRSLILALMYAMVAIFAFYLSYYIRFDGVVSDEYVRQFTELALPVAGIQLISLFALRQGNVVMSYFSLVDLRSIVLANGVSSIVNIIILLLIGIKVPRGVVMLDILLLTGGICVIRIAMRYWVEWFRFIKNKSAKVCDDARLVAVVGAGDAGAHLVRELLSKPSLKWKPSAIFDDDPVKWGQRIHGVTVVGKPELLRETKWRGRFRKIIVIDSAASPARLAEIARIAADLGIISEMLPAIDQLVDGSVKVSQLRPIRIDDLLRRPSIPLNHLSIQEGLCGKVIAVTGAGGSIGSEICRQIVRARPRELLLIDRCEVQLFQIEQELLQNFTGCKLISLIADVTDPERIREIFGKHRPYAIYHAAAHKHVPLMEAQPTEAIKNNSFGTENLIKISFEFNVCRFVLISTDKAINPTNVMGASKRLAEIFLQAFQQAYPSSTRFMAVRFGNVLGSSGSVVPIFQRQIAAGGPITVTHPEVTRYFMTIPEAVGLVLQAGALGKGGEIFVLDMGEPVKIVDLARHMIELSGYRLGIDIDIKFVGLRPGEKMFEEISHNREKLTETGHPKILRFISMPTQLPIVEEYFDNLRRRLYVMESNEIKKTIQEMVPEYKPFSG
jgi:FlaA1/EpsC-like NDP-sugar epimerase